MATDQQGYSIEVNPVPVKTDTKSVASPSTDTKGPQVEDFSGRFDTNRWLLYGSAEHLRTEDTIQLTAARLDQLGMLFHLQPVNSEGLRIEFSFEIEDGTREDGLGFLLLRSMPDLSQIDSRYHAGGGWPSRYFKGYAILFDTHRNRAGSGDYGGRTFHYPVDDSSSNFVALAELGAGGEVFDLSHLATRNLDLNLTNSGVFDAEVDFDDGRVKVYLSNSQADMDRTLVIDHTIRTNLVHMSAQRSGTGRSVCP